MTPRRRWMALAVLCLAQLIVFIDNTILNVTIPTLVRELGATPSDVQWIVEAYVLVFAGILLTTGKLGDRFGRKGVMSVGLVILALASLSATFSSSAEQLIVARAVMGVGGALVVPATLAIVVNIFTDPSERRRAIAYWSLMNAAAILIGPVTGGLLLRHFWWGACFLVNVPVVAVALVLARIFVPTSKDPQASGFDVAGGVLSTLSLGALVWSIVEAPARGWNDLTVIGALTLAGVAGTLFARWELRSRDPVLDLRAFRSPQLSAATLTMTIAFTAMIGSIFVTIQALQLVKGYSPLTAAVATSGPIVGVNFLVIPRAPWLIERFGLRKMVTFGTALICCSLITIAATTVDSGYANLFVGFVLIALAFCVVVPASTDAIMTAHTAEKAGGASAINQMTRQLGSAMGVAIGGSIAAAIYRSGFQAPTGRSIDPRAVDSARESITATLHTASVISEPARSALLRAGREAFLMGMRGALLTFAILALAGTVVAARKIPRQVKESSAPTPAELTET